MEQNSILHTTLSLDSDIPLYAQLVGIIKRSISTGALPVGALLPSEAELCRCLSISRNTVRQAIGELEDEGLVVRKRGRGTFVADPATNRRGVRYSFTTEVSSMGKVPSSTLVDFAVEVPKPTVCEKMELREGTPVRDGDSLRPVCPEDIVILLRSPGSGGGYFQKALEARGIRCASGGGTDLLQTEEIGTLRSFLQIIWNPRQDIPLVSTLASPIFGFTADELAEIRSARKKGAFYDALLLSDSPKVKTFLNTLDRLRREARMNPLTALLENCFALTRLDSVYAAMPGGEAKTANIQTFYQLAADFENGNLKDLGQFLDFLDAMEEKGLISAASSPAGCVTIMSIHKSKGLEFPVVFLCNLSRRFNQEDLRAQILCDQKLGLGLSAVDRQTRVRYPSLAKRAIGAKMATQSISEEMRVLYVAMTRAKDRLVMTYASQTLEKDLQAIALRRDFDGGERLRHLAYTDLDKAMLLGVEMTIQEMQQRQVPIHTNTLQARDWLRQHGVTTED